MSAVGQLCRSILIHTMSAYDVNAEELLKPAIRRDGPEAVECYYSYLVGMIDGMRMPPELSSAWLVGCHAFEQNSKERCILIEMRWTFRARTC
jgi:hypothetical protein